MKKKECKVIFNDLIIRTWKKENEEPKELPFNDILPLMEYCKKLSRLKRFFDLKDNKFCFVEVDSIVKSPEGNTIISGFFKSARNEFRPNVIDKKTGSERKNPKAITEGDINTTHFIIKIVPKHNCVYFIHEFNYHGVTTNNMVNYFSYMNLKYLSKNGIKQSYSIRFHIICRENFREELERLSRAKVAEIYFNKRLLGSDALNFSNRDVALKTDIKLVATSQLMANMKEFAVDIFNVFETRPEEISKVRIMGTDENENDIIIDTSFMSKVEFLDIDINEETGELNSAQMFTGLKGFAKLL